MNTLEQLTKMLDPEGERKSSWHYVLVQHGETVGLREVHFNDKGELFGITQQEVTINGETVEDWVKWAKIAIKDAEKYPLLSYEDFLTISKSADQDDIVGLIMREREKQLIKYSVEQDREKYKAGELLQAAKFVTTLEEEDFPGGWNEEFKAKIKEKGELERYIISGALCLAQNDVEPNDMAILSLEGLIEIGDKMLELQKAQEQE